MKKRIIAILALTIIALSFGAAAKAQNIQITKFEQNATSLIARDPLNLVTDNNGEACAIIRFFVRDNTYIIEPNAGVLRTDTLIGEMRMWVPKGTKRITVRHEGMFPLVNYKIPIPIESKNTYEATIETANDVYNNVHQSHPVYLGIGYSLMPVSGVSATLGLMTHHHNLEIGATYGLEKTDNLYFYNKSDEAVAAYKYHPIHLQARYGYSIDLSKLVDITPQAGAGYSIAIGEKVNNLTHSTSKYQLAKSLYAFGAFRAILRPAKHFAIQITPEYVFCVSRDHNSEWISKTDEQFKGWTEGFSLNAGIMIFF